MDVASTQRVTVDAGESPAMSGSTSSVSTVSDIRPIPSFNLGYTDYHKAPKLHQQIARRLIVAAIMQYTLDWVASMCRVPLELVEAIDSSPCMQDYIREEVDKHQQVIMDAHTKMYGLAESAVGVFERMMSTEASEQAQLRAAENVLDRHISREFSRHTRREKEGAADNLSVQTMRQRFEEARQVESQQAQGGDYAPA